MAEGSAFGPKTLKGLKKGRTPCANHQQRPEENDGVNAETSACLDPIDVGVEVQPESKFVERESGANAVCDGHNTAEKYGHWRMGAAQVKKPSVTHEQQDQDSPNQVMDVLTTHHYPLEWPFSTNDEGDQQSHSKERDKKCD